MDERETDELLWELSRAIGDTSGAVPPEEVLEAYRRGALDAAAAREVEAILAASGAARRRLAEIATRPAAFRRRAGGARWLGLAAAVTLAVLTPVVWRAVGPDACGPSLDDRASLPAFEVRVHALAPVRSAPAEDPAPGAVRALPDTPVRIVVEAVEHARAGLEFAVYRLDSDRLVKLGASDGVTIRTYRGGAEIVAPAARLAGPAPGRREFFVAVAPAGSAPAEIAVGGDPLATLERATGGRAWRRHLDLIRPDTIP